MNKLRIFSLLFVGVFLFSHVACASTYGPVFNYTDLLENLSRAQDGDIVLVSGYIDADTSLPLTTPYSVKVSSSADGIATLSGLHLRDATLSFSDINLADSLSIDGNSYIVLTGSTSVSGSGSSAISFTGNGELIIEPNCQISGLNGADGIVIQHTDGFFYAAIEGTVSGGDNAIGGAGVTVSSLGNDGMIYVNGQITGGDGNDVGGNAINLYDISGNAFISVTGSATGGSGHIGGDGVQIISVDGISNIGVDGVISGGDGSDYGGSALFVMNPTESSAISMGGELHGGNVTTADGAPGQSLTLVGNGSINHVYSNECLFEDGTLVYPTYASTESETSDISIASEESDDSQIALTDDLPSVVASADFENAPAEEPEILFLGEELPEPVTIIDGADSTFTQISEDMNPAETDFFDDLINNPADEYDISQDFAEVSSSLTPENPDGISMEYSEDADTSVVPDFFSEDGIQDIFPVDNNADPENDDNIDIFTQDDMNEFSDTDDSEIADLDMNNSDTDDSEAADSEASDETEESLQEDAVPADTPQPAISLERRTSVAEPIATPDEAIARSSQENFSQSDSSESAVEEFLDEIFEFLSPDDN